MTAAPALSYIVPVHNQERTLQERMTRLVAGLENRPGAEVIMVENGSTDRSEQVLDALVRGYAGPVRLTATVSPVIGIGAALRRGMGLASGDVMVLTAADLPFGFSDLDAWEALDPPPPLAIGSKGHPRSQVEVGWQRRMMSLGFRGLRRALLGLRVRDSQGTIIIDRWLAVSLLPRLCCDDYLMTTELVAWAARAGFTAVELPVDYPRQPGGSTVSPIRDSLRMAVGMWRLRGRLRRARAQ